MKQLPRDIEVEIEFLRHEHGGRKTPAVSGYRTQFFYDGSDWDSRLEYIGVETAEPGRKVRAYIAFLSPQEHEGKIYPCMPFLIREGNRTVGFGAVLSILNLPKSAAHGTAST